MEWEEGSTDKIESLVKEIRVDQWEDPHYGRVRTTGALRDRYCNFENAYFECWTSKCVGGHNSSRKRKRQKPRSRNIRIIQLQVLTATR